MDLLLVLQVPSDLYNYNDVCQFQLGVQSLYCGGMHKYVPLCTGM